MGTMEQTLTDELSLFSEDKFRLRSVILLIVIITTCYVSLCLVLILKMKTLP